MKDYTFGFMVGTLKSALLENNVCQMSPARMYALLEVAQEGVLDVLQHVLWNGTDFTTDGSLQLLNRVQTIGKDSPSSTPTGSSLELLNLGSMMAKSNRQSRRSDNWETNLGGEPYLCVQCVV
jgi:hypothetical protein